MRGSIQQSRAIAAWDLAARQHGVVARWQLSELGFTAGEIDRRVANGRLHVLWRGVYAVGRPDVTRRGRLMAAALACGPDAVLSHASAGELWEMAGRVDPIDVSVLAGMHRRLPGIRVHRRVALSPTDVTSHDGIPVTSPVCTLIDMAASLRRPKLEAALIEADKLDLVTPEALQEGLDIAAGRRGVGALRKLSERLTLTLTDSELERRFLPIARAAGLSPPQSQAWLNGFRVDFYWEDGTRRRDRRPAISPHAGSAGTRP